MLEKLAGKLLEKDLADYSRNLFIESINTASNMSGIKRISMLNECGSCSTDNDLDTFRTILDHVKFADHSTADDRKEMLYKSVTNINSLNEESKDSYDEITKKISQLRSEYLDACKTDDTKRKNLIVSIIKNYEQTKRDLKEENK